MKEKILEFVRQAGLYVLFFAMLAFFVYWTWKIILNGWIF